MPLLKSGGREAFVPCATASKQNLFSTSVGWLGTGNRVSKHPSLFAFRTGDCQMHAPGLTQRVPLTTGS